MNSAAKELHNAIHSLKMALPDRIDEPALKRLLSSALREERERVYKDAKPLLDPSHLDGPPSWGKKCPRCDAIAAFKKKYAPRAIRGNDE